MNPRTILFSFAGTTLAIVCGLASTAASQESRAAAAKASAEARFVTYIGTLEDAKGRPITSATSVDFSLYKLPHGGTAEWKETQKIVPDKSGRYKVRLGSTRKEGMPAEMFAVGESRWLAVQVEGAEEQPRSLLVAVPAGVANAGAIRPSAFVLSIPQSDESPAKAATSSAELNAIPLITGAGSIQASSMINVGYFAQPLASPQAAAVTGITDAPGGVGVWGQDNRGIGVYGTGEIGFATDSNAQQARTKGGWAKALVWFTGEYDGYIIYCYNSTLSGTAATQGTCGFNWDKTGVGDYIIDLGFDVSDRFFSVSGSSVY